MEWKILSGHKKNKKTLFHPGIEFLVNTAQSPILASSCTDSSKPTILL